MTHRYAPQFIVYLVMYNESHRHLKVKFLFHEDCIDMRGTFLQCASLVGIISLLCQSDHSLIRMLITTFFEVTM